MSSEFVRRAREQQLVFPDDCQVSAGTVGAGGPTFLVFLLDCLRLAEDGGLVLQVEDGSRLRGQPPHGQLLSLLLALRR